MSDEVESLKKHPNKRLKAPPRPDQFQKGHDPRRGRPNVNDYATPETRAKGLAVARANQIERAKSYRQRLAEKLQAQVDADYDAMRKAWLNGDTSAFFKMVDQAFGKPHQSVALSGEEGPLQLVVRSAFDVGDDSGRALPGDGETKRLGEGVG